MRLCKNGSCFFAKENYSLVEVEALAAMRAIVFAKELALLSIILEGDSEVIISTSKCDKKSFASFGHLIAQVKFHAESLQSFSFSHLSEK